MHSLERKPQLHVEPTIFARRILGSKAARYAGRFKEERRCDHSDGRGQVRVIENVAGADGKGQVVAMLGAFAAAKAAAAGAEPAETAVRSTAASPSATASSRSTAATRTGASRDTFELRCPKAPG